MHCTHIPWNQDVALDKKHDVAIGFNKTHGKEHHSKVVVFLRACRTSLEKMRQNLESDCLNCLVTFRFVIQRCWLLCTVVFNEALSNTENRKSYSTVHPEVPALQCISSFNVIRGIVHRSRLRVTGAVPVKKQELSHTRHTSTH